MINSMMEYSAVVPYMSAEEFNDLVDSALPDVSELLALFDNELQY